jgi:hypothetical protein
VGVKSQAFYRPDQVEPMLEHTPYCGCRPRLGSVQLSCVRGYLVEVPVEGVLAGPALQAKLDRAAPSRSLLEAEWERVDPDGVAALRESAAALNAAAASPTFNPAYQTARCGQLSAHGPHVVDHGPDQPRNCPGTALAVDRG